MKQSFGADHNAAGKAATTEVAQRHQGKGHLGSPGADARKAQKNINADPSLSGDMPAGGGDDSDGVSDQ